MRKHIETLIAVVIFVIFMAGIGIFSFMTYREEKAMLYAQIDQRLESAARSAVFLLSADFHDRALHSRSISSDEDITNIHRLSMLAESARLNYVYTFIRSEGKIHFTASSATPEERKTGHNLTRYFDVYEDASPHIHHLFDHHRIIFDETPDKWGTFRSIMIPFDSPKGNSYAVGADIAIDDLQAMLNHLVVKHIVFALIVFGMSFISLLWRLRHINRLAYYDSLTGLPNRNEFSSRIDYVISDANRNHTNIAIMFLDLDHFKEVNDTLGHNIGDHLLFQAAKRLRNILRTVDTVSRLGGDEFVLIFPNTDAQSASAIAEKILVTLSHSYHFYQHELTVTASIGIAIYPYDGTDMETLSKNADTAMYSAKKEGRNCYRFFTQQLHEATHRHLMLSGALHHALERNEFSLCYQPQIDLQTGALVGCEALLRWENHELGTVAPDEFIPIAEETGLIHPIGEWVLKTAFSQTALWRKRFPLIVAINISALQLRHPDFPEFISTLLAQNGLSSDAVELELTESAAMHNPQVVIRILQELHERGLKIAIDDFGTGYSSLFYLKKFNITKLKIDRSFIRDIITDQEDKAIVNAIIKMAAGLGLKVIAEGVETAEQLEYLKLHGCAEVQGYYYSKPLNASDFEIYMQTYHSADA